MGCRSTLHEASFMQATHMAENLNIFQFTLTAAEMSSLSGLPQNKCVKQTIERKLFCTRSNTSRYPSPALSPLPFR